MTSPEDQRPNAPGKPVDRESLEATLEQTRLRFHELVASLSDEQLALESVVTRWTVKEVLCHMSRVMEIAFAMMVRRARKNRGMPTILHSRLTRRLNFMAARQAGRGADRGEVLRRYDTANSKMLTLLRNVENSQWSNRTAFPSGTPLTMERIFSVGNWRSSLVLGQIAMRDAECDDVGGHRELDPACLGNKRAQIGLRLGQELLELFFV